MKYTYLLLVLMALVTSCSKEDDTLKPNQVGLEVLNAQNEVRLIADFTFESQVVNEGDALNITNLSTEGVTYKWTLGSENEVSIEQTPNHSFFAHGFYDITLTITNQNNKEASITKTIEVLCNFGGGDHSTDESES